MIEQTDSRGMSWRYNDDAYQFEVQVREGGHWMAYNVDPFTQIDECEEERTYQLMRLKRATDSDQRKEIQMALADNDYNMEVMQLLIGMSRKSHARGLF